MFCIKEKISAVPRLASGGVLCTRVSRGLTQEFRDWFLMLRWKWKKCCVSHTQRIDKFHQNEMVFFTCHLSSLIDNHIEEPERLNMNAIKAEHL